MLRRSHIITTTALIAACAVPASAAAVPQDLRSPDTKDAAAAAVAAQQPSQDLRSPDTKDAAREAGSVQLRGSHASYGSEAHPGVSQDLRSPDARDAAEGRGLNQAPDEQFVLQRDYGSPDAADAARDLPRVLIPEPVVEIREASSSGFHWGDAGIGAAGLLGLFAIAAGSTLLVTARRRRGFGVTAH
jgi:hypothetical protein